MFTYIPPPNFAVASPPEYAVSCTSPSGTFFNCPTLPTVHPLFGTSVYGWNWSANASLNQMYYGDEWRVSFNLVNTGPPYGTVPAIVCDTKTCLSDGSVPVLGHVLVGALPPAEHDDAGDHVVPVSPSSSFRSSACRPARSSRRRLRSFPPRSRSSSRRRSPIRCRSGCPIVTPVGTFSIQATAAGLLMAGITRLTLKNKPIAMQIAAKTGPAQSKFDAAQRQGPATGHFE